MIRRLAALVLLALATLVTLAALASAHVEIDPARTVVSSASAEEATTTTTNDLPGTTLEADQRDDGNTSTAPWIIGSGLAAAVAIAVGGTLLKRKQEREL